MTIRKYYFDVDFIHTFVSKALSRTLTKYWHFSPALEASACLVQPKVWVQLQVLI